MDYTESKLREEVAFWQNLIDEWDERQSQEVRIRMRESLEYAEKKLERYLNAQDSPADRTKGNGRSTDGG
ncbi:MAG: hypothetical protein KDI63_15010 [Gammaproteobacteria bacterium]|nr:hypothetical protein [Gammaproteobacteria bacterium]